MKNTESMVVDSPRKSPNQATNRAAIANKQLMFMDQLLTLENEVRLITEERELAVHLCNSTRALLPFKQSFFGSINTNTNRFRLKNASSIPSIDRDAPFTLWLERVISQMVKQTGGTKQLCFTLPQFCNEQDEENSTYLYKEFLWTPQINNKALTGGFVVARDTPWTESEQALAQRLSLLYAHATAATKGGYCSWQPLPCCPYLSLR